MLVKNELKEKLIYSIVEARTKGTHWILLEEMKYSIVVMNDGYSIHIEFGEWDYVSEEYNSKQFFNFYRKRATPEIASEVVLDYLIGENICLRS